MRRFTRLFQQLDAATGGRARHAALVSYFRAAPARDAAWAVRLLSGQRPRRPVSGSELCRLAAAAAGLPLWLLHECRDVVGDLAETLALLLPPGAASCRASLAEIIEQRTLPLARMPEAARAESIAATWSELDAAQRLVWHKIMTGSFRVGVAARTVARALAEVAGVDHATMAGRLAGARIDTPQRYEALIAGEVEDDAPRPYPFFLAQPLAGDPATLGDRDDWQVEWKYDGVRAQLVRRGDRVHLWSRGEELIGPAFPEIVTAAEAALPPDTVLDGEVLAWHDDRPLGFAALQRRLGRRRVEPSFWPEVPVTFMAFDLLERGGEDRRGEPCRQRRRDLVELLEARRERRDDALRLAPLLPEPDWESLAARREESRELGVEGLMLKRRSSPYGIGRTGSDWWKWKIDPYTVDAVLLAAERGHGRRAGLFTDFTFGVWSGDELVPFTRAYSGLTDEEFREVNRFIARATLERRGPVRLLRPELVFEIAFEGIQASSRHKSGIALRFPRMHRWRRDKRIDEADTLAGLQALLAAAEGRGP